MPRVQGSGARANKKTAGGVTPAAVGYGRGWSQLNSCGITRPSRTIITGRPVDV
ncbi:hypothetical protein LBMAG46_40590 [Planctomycetia bacterium]|nr:hypothetical protein LBMAG46_40590 [Planctomycetia bacterium]